MFSKDWFAQFKVNAKVQNVLECLSRVPLYLINTTLTLAIATQSCHKAMVMMMTLTHICHPKKIQVKIPCLPRFWSVMNMSDTRLENCDLEDQICASHKWDGGHERVGFFSRFCDGAKEHENEDCSELLLKQNTFL